jgi:hypothetical protein
MLKKSKKETMELVGMKMEKAKLVPEFQFSHEQEGFSTIPEACNYQPPCILEDIETISEASVGENNRRTQEPKRGENN